MVSGIAGPSVSQTVSQIDRHTVLTDEGGLEQGLGTAEPFIADGDDLSVRKFVALLQRGRRCRRAHLVLKVQSDVTQLLLDVSNDFSLRCSDTDAHTASHTPLPAARRALPMARPYLWSRSCNRVP